MKPPDFMRGGAGGWGEQREGTRSHKLLDSPLLVSISDISALPLALLLRIRIDKTRPLMLS